MHSYSDFAEPPLQGSKINIKELFNKRIALLKFAVRKSRYKKGMRYGILQYYFVDDKEQTVHVTNTGSDVLLDQLQQHESQLPFETTIVQIGDYYSFS